MPKNIQAIEQLFLFHMLARLCSKILQARFQQYVNWELPGVQAKFKKGRGTRDQIANIRWIIEKARELKIKHLPLLHWLHWSLWLCGNSRQCKILEEMGIPNHLTFLLRNLMQDKMHQLVMHMEHQTGSKLGRSVSRLYIVALLI